MLILNDDCLLDIFILLDIDSLCSVVLRRFGHQIKSIEGRSSKIIDFKLIAKYCRPKLQHTELYGVNIDYKLAARHFRRLKRLKSLRIHYCNLIGNVHELFGNCSQLEQLQVYLSLKKVFP